MTKRVTLLHALTTHSRITAVHSVNALLCTIHLEKRKGRTRHTDNMQDNTGKTGCGAAASRFPAFPAEEPCLMLDPRGGREATWVNPFKHRTLMTSDAGVKKCSH